MNNAFVIVIASLGAMLWLYGVLQERRKNSVSDSIWKIVHKSDNRFEDSLDTNTVTIESLERELGIEPDHYLCDRIARINEALLARRDKTSSKKKRGVS